MHEDTISMCLILVRIVTSVSPLTSKNDELVKVSVESGLRPYHFLR